MLTKSDFLIFIDSPLHLWAKKHDQLESFPSSQYAQHIAKQGYEVQKLAQQFLKHKVATEYPDAHLSFEETLIDGNFESRIDALVHDNIYDTYDMYEIKSSCSIKKEHEYDVTFQYLIGKTQLNLHKIYLVHVNNKYVKKGKIDLTQFFVVDDVMEIVGKREEEVLKSRETAFNILSMDNPPINMHCYKPADCRCKSLCHPNLPETSIYDLCRGTQKQYQYLVDLGCRNLTDIPDDFILKPFQRLQIQSAKINQPFIDKEAIRHELENLVYPLYFLDYETFNPAIPLYDAYAPYQNITFQYSIHVLDSPESEIKHHEYLVTDTDEPSEALIKRLLSVIGEKGSVIVWNKSFECGRNRELAKLQPQFAAAMESINERIYDLMDPFKKGYYVDYRFRGSQSIKKVLPVLVPELSYKELDIGEGTAAMINWFKITHDAHSAFDEDSIHLKDKIKQDLLKYCELDTFAMVEIWKRLNNLMNADA